MSIQPDHTQRDELSSRLAQALSSRGELSDMQVMDREVRQYLDEFPDVWAILERNKTSTLPNKDQIERSMMAQRIGRERDVIAAMSGRYDQIGSPPHITDSIPYNPELDEYVTSSISNPNERGDYFMMMQGKRDDHERAIEDLTYEATTQVKSVNGEPSLTERLRGEFLGDERYSMTREQIAEREYVRYLGEIPDLSATERDVPAGQQRDAALEDRITREAEVINAMTTSDPEHPAYGLGYSPSTDERVSKLITFEPHQKQYERKMEAQREAHREAERPSVMELIDERIDFVVNATNKKLTPSQESQRANEMMSQMIAQSAEQDPESRHRSLNRVMDAMETIINEPVEGATRGWRVDHATFAHMDLVVGDFGGSTPDDELYIRSSELASQQLEKDMTVARVHDRVFPQERFDASPYRRDDTRALMEQINANMDTTHMSSHPEYRNLAMNSSFNTVIRHVEESRDGTSVQGKQLESIAEVMGATSLQEHMAIEFETAWKFKKVADQVARHDGVYAGLSYTAERVVSLAESQAERGSNIDYNIPDATIMANRRKANAPTKEREVEREVEAEVQHDASDDYDF